MYVGETGLELIHAFMAIALNAAEPDVKKCEALSKNLDGLKDVAAWSTSGAAPKNTALFVHGQMPGVMPIDQVLQKAFSDPGQCEPVVEKIETLKKYYPVKALNYPARG